MYPNQPSPLETLASFALAAAAGAITVISMNAYASYLRRKMEQKLRTPVGQATPKPDNQ